MLVTGYQLRSAIKNLDEEIKGLINLFINSIKMYPSEVNLEGRRLPSQIDMDIELLEVKRCALQAAQSTYNEQVKIILNGRSVSLKAGIAERGKLERAHQRWDTAYNTVTGRSRNEYYENERDPTKERKSPMVGAEDALKNRRDIKKEMDAVKQICEAANVTQMDLPIDPSLFE